MAGPNPTVSDARTPPFGECCTGPPSAHWKASVKEFKISASWITRQERLLNALRKYTLAPRCEIFGDGWAHSKSCTELLSLRSQQWRSTNPLSPRHHGQALPALCHRSRRIFCSQLLIVPLNSNVSSPSRIFWQPYKSPLNLSTFLILRRKYKNMFF